MKKPDFKISYSQLPDIMFTPTRPDPAPKPNYAWVNVRFGHKIGLDDEWLNSQQSLDFFSGNADSDEYSSLAMAYSGHQFGHFSAQLGDGRALLVGEFSGQDGIGYDIHLKGSGSTAYSRRGDGKSTLRAALKEVLFSEYLASIGIATTRALAVFETGEVVRRETSHKGAVLVRLAKSLIRVGTFEFANLSEDKLVVGQLADFILQREFSHISDAGAVKYQKLFEQILSRQAELIANWMSAGFIHGVMNTDNMALSGETIDFGPCAFMENFKPSQVFSSIDKQGRYAWNRQAEIAVWNLTRLAEVLLPLFDDDQKAAIAFAEAELNAFMPRFGKHFTGLMMQKTGLTLTAENAETMMNQTFAALTASKPDYTLFFRYLSDILKGMPDDKLLALCEDQEPIKQWLETWQQHIANESLTAENIAEKMEQINPLYVPRLGLVEHALDDAQNGDLTSFNKLLTALQYPYVERTEFSEFAMPEGLTDGNRQTFCET
ncbi:MAG: YdiU family protein [Rhizobiales bacterium]|nr:YdiU family protein [Hyphomicrobiales bacterium]NRB15529.1 YdiU family protein [Hyphomicrobiales bacterium]